MELHGPAYLLNSTMFSYAGLRNGQIIAGFIATLVKKFLNNDSGAKFELAFYFMSPFYTP